MSVSIVAHTRLLFQCISPSILKWLIAQAISPGVTRLIHIHYQKIDWAIVGTRWKVKDKAAIYHIHQGAATHYCVSEDRPVKQKWPGPFEYHPKNHIIGYRPLLPLWLSYVCSDAATQKFMKIKCYVGNRTVSVKSPKRVVRKHDPDTLCRMWWNPLTAPCYILGRWLFRILSRTWGKLKLLIDSWALLYGCMGGNSYTDM